MKTFSYILFFALLTSSCSPKVEQKPLEEKPIENPWKWLKIEVDKELIWIFATEDTCFYRKKLDEYEISKEGEKTRKIIEGRFVLSKQQRDSVFFLGEDAIKNFVESDGFVSCYAGQYVSVKLEGYTGSIACRYSSISDWTKVSSTLSKLAEMTFDKVEK
jgi:hypothetical protein